MLQLFSKKQGEKGFTLIELLVVIAIIGILATIVLVALNNARGRARDARRQSDIRQFSLALEMYYNDNALYPTGSDPLSATHPVYLAVKGSSYFPEFTGQDPQQAWYRWIANTPTSYCTFSVLEQTGQWFAAKTGGNTKQVTVAPTTTGCF